MIIITILSYYCLYNILLQDTSGVKDDIIAALLLHPECEECLSLIARVFPGKTAQELMHSHEASTVRAKLDTEMKRVAKLYAPASDKPSNLDTIPPIASQYLEGIELKMAELVEEKSNSGSRKSDAATSVAVPSLQEPANKLHFKSHGSLSAKSQAGSRAASTKSRKSSADKKKDATMQAAKTAEEIEQEEESSSQPRKLYFILTRSSYYAMLIT